MAITKMAPNDQAKASSHDWRIGSALESIWEKGRRSCRRRRFRGMHQDDDQHAAPGVVEHPVEDDHPGDRVNNPAGKGLCGTAPTSEPSVPESLHAR